jgi:hypothetical protein
VVVVEVLPVVVVVTEAPPKNKLRNLGERNQTAVFLNFLYFIASSYL